MTLFAEGCVWATSLCRFKGGPHSYDNNNTLCGALGGVPPVMSLFSLLGTLSKVSFPPLQIYPEP